MAGIQNLPAPSPPTIEHCHKNQTNSRDACRTAIISRSRTKGQRLPTLSKVLADPGTTWKRLMVPAWYGEGERPVELAFGTTVWRHAGMSILPTRWLLLHDPLGRFSPQALLCTDAGHSPEQVLRWFIQRWQLEVNFEETRAHLEVETQRQWSDRAIARTTPACSACFPS